MKKKILSLLLALTLLGQSAYAINLRDYVATEPAFSSFINGGVFDYSLFDGTIDTVATAMAKTSGSATFAEYPLSTNPLTSSENFDFKVTLDMDNVLAKFNALYATTTASIIARGGANTASLLSQFEDSIVTGNFTVRVTYGALTRGTSEYVFGQEGHVTPDIFVFNGPVDYTQNPMDVNFTIKDGVTVHYLHSVPTALNDLYTTISDITTSSYNTSIPVQAQLVAAEVILKDAGQEYGKISFTSNESTVYVRKTSGNGSVGGGSVSFAPKAYTVVDEVETEIEVAKKNSSYYVEIDKIAAPEKEGFIFDGWYLDEEFTEPASGTLTITKTTYLYAKFKPIEEPSASIIVDGVETPVEITEEDGKLYIDVDSIPVPEKDGFAFEGWYEEPYLITQAEGKVELTGKLSLYPKYVNLKAPADLISEDHFAYIVGYPDGEVKPNGNITREEVVAAFYRLLDPAKRAEIETTEHSFPDVNSGRWSEEEIATLANGGYIVGDENGYFNPAKPITRAEFVTLASQFAENDSATLHYFTDIEGHWAEENIKKASMANYWIFGYEDGTFRPDSYITRAEAMAIINRMLVRYADVNSEYAKQWPDLSKDAWYYGPVIEATTDNFYERHENGWSEAWITEADANQPSETPAE